MRLLGRRIVGGRAEGIVLVSGPLSLLGGVDLDTGEIRDPGNPARGERLKDRILAVPHAKGSTVGSYVLYGLQRRNWAPRAILSAKAETILVVGAVLANVPMVDGIPVDCLQTGDRVAVDADAGLVDLPDLVEKGVVSSFLEREGRVLVVQRSDKVGSFQGKWSGISGFLEGSEDPQDRALREIEEETGLTDVSPIARGPPVFSRAGGIVYRIHPFRFACPRGDVRLDWENVEFRWVDPTQIARMDGVPKLLAAYRATIA